MNITAYMRSTHCENISVTYKHKYESYQNPFHSLNDRPREFYWQFKVTFFFFMQEETIRPPRPTHTHKHAHLSLLSFCVCERVSFLAY